MLEVTIPRIEGFNDLTGEFITVSKEETLLLEHSLLSMAKWESKWHKPFLDSCKEHTVEESIDYIRCMTISPKNVDPGLYRNVPQNVMDKITNYIDDPMTATWFSDSNHSSGRSNAVTSEIIYYWMITYNIPFDPCEKWHLNRLTTLIRVCSEKNSPQKKMSKSEIMERNRRLNEQRKAQMNSKG